MHDYPEVRFIEVSIHAPREGCDCHSVSVAASAHTFQFTHPGRGATPLEMQLMQANAVSIHAPREGCDSCARYSTHPPARFNSRTPGGVRHVPEGFKTWLEEFQFTHPGRGATPLLGT